MEGYVQYVIDDLGREVPLVAHLYKDEEAAVSAWLAVHGLTYGPPSDAPGAGAGAVTHERYGLYL